MDSEHNPVPSPAELPGRVVNFLAHSALAFDDPALLAGQFAGDFVRGRDLSGFPPRVASGIRLHRRVDAFTDAHPEVAAARRAFEPPLRRHAGIVVDVVFDHLLAGRWPAPAGRSLPAHARWVDDALARHGAVLPERLAGFALWLARERLLEGNAEAASVGRTLERLSRRSDRMAPLAAAAIDIEPVIERLRLPFERFWPSLEVMATDWIAVRDAADVDVDVGGDSDGGVVR